MNLKSRIVLGVFLSVVLIGLAVLLWAYQNGKITIFGSEQSHEVVYDYSTAEKWNIGQFDNTAYLTLPNFMLAKFNYDSTSKPPFPDATSRCNTSDTKCLGSNKIIEVNLTSGGLLKFYHTVTFYDDGKVVDEAQTEVYESPPPQTITCYSGEELAQLLSMVDGSGFWDAKDYPYQSVIDPTNYPSYKVTVNLKGKEKQVLMYSRSQNAPEKLNATFQTLLDWVASRQNRDNKTCYPLTGWGTYGSTASYTSTAIGSTNLTSFSTFKIDSKDLYLPSRTSSNKFPGSFQFAGSKDNYVSWSTPVIPSVTCVTTPCNIESVSIDLSKIDQLKDSRSMKVKINYDIDNLYCASGDTACLSKSGMKYSPLISGFSITANESGTDMTLPTKPSGVQSSNVTGDSVQLSWSASTDSSGIRQYRIYDADNISKDPILTSELTYIVTGLSVGTHRFYIRAEDMNGNLSDPSDIITVVISGTTPTPTPTPTATTTATPTPTTTTGPGTNITHLISTGGALWFNLLIALILSAIIMYFVTRKKRADY